MSQDSSRALDPSWLSISLAKFSHNSSPYGTRNFTWNHVGFRNDLDFILRGTRVVDENGNFHTRILMKVNAGAEELELQDLGELVQHINAFDHSLGGENPVQVVIKSPFLAMRYPKSANIVRRIQLKFHNNSDFAKVVNFVKELGLPITETTPGPTPLSRPSVSSSPSLLSATSTPASTSTFLTAPSLLSASSASNSRISLPTPRSSLHSAIRAADKSISLTSDSSSQPEFKVPMRPNSSISQAHRSSSALSYATSQISRPATALSVFSSPSSSALTSLDLPNKAMMQPTSVYIAQMQRESQSRRPSLPILSTIKSSQGDSRANLSLLQSQLNSHEHLVAERTQCSERQLSASPFFAPRRHAPGLAETFTGELNVSNQDQSGWISDSRDSQRLSSAYLESNPGLNLSVPPKRDLPFPKPREASPQRSASVSDLPPLPKPTPASRPGSANFAKLDKASTPVLKPAKKRVAQRKSTAAKPAEIVESPPANSGNKVDATTSQAMPEDEPSPLAAKSAAVASKPTSAASGLQSKAATKKRAAPTRPSSATKRPKMVDQTTQTQTLSGRDHTSALPSFRSEEVPAAIVARLPPTPASTLSGPPESYLQAVDTFVTRYKARPPPQELWERPGWAEADVEQRQLLLNNFICENLENKDFLRLCEDTAVAWRRIGLGM